MEEDKAIENFVIWFSDFFAITCLSYLQLAVSYCTVHADSDLFFERKTEKFVVFHFEVIFSLLETSMLIDQRCENQVTREWFPLGVDCRRSVENFLFSRSAHKTK